MKLNDYLADVKTAVSKTMDDFKSSGKSRLLIPVAADCNIAGASGARVVSMCDGKWRMISDASAQWAAFDLGPGGMDMFCGAVASSLGHLYVIYAALLDIPLEKLDIKVEAVIDGASLFNPEEAEDPPILKDFKYSVDLESSAPEDKIKTLHEMSENKCPLVNTIRQNGTLTRIDAQ